MTPEARRPRKPQETPPSPEIAYCKTTCPQRETCPLRKGTDHLILAYQAFELEYEGGQNEEAQALLRRELFPFVQDRLEDRLDCARDKLAHHQTREEEQERVRQRALSLVPLLRDALGIDPEDLRRLLSEAEASRPSLTVQSTSPAQPSSPSPAPAPGPSEEAAVPEERLTDEEAWTRLVDARERWPSDDAAAWRELSNTSPITQNQAARIARQHNLPGWSKANLTAWRDPTAKSDHSLNKERQTPPPEPPTTSPTPTSEGEPA